jgi:hypothetical protein
MKLDNATQINIIQNILGKSKTKNHNGRKVAKKTPRRVWSVADELLAIDLYKTKADEAQIKAACEMSGIKYSSMKMKLSNLEFLNSGNGLENVAETTKILFNKVA